MLLLLLDMLSSIFFGHHLESQTVIYDAAAVGCCYKIAANFAQTMLLLLLLLQTIGSLY